MFDEIMILFIYNLLVVYAEFRPEPSAIESAGFVLFAATVFLIGVRVIWATITLCKMTYLRVRKLHFDRKNPKRKRSTLSKVSNAKPVSLAASSAN